MNSGVFLNTDWNRGRSDRVFMVRQMRQMETEKSGRVGDCIFHRLHFTHILIGVRLMH